MSDFNSENISSGFGGAENAEVISKSYSAEEHDESTRKIDGCFGIKNEELDSRIAEDSNNSDSANSYGTKEDAARRAESASIYNSQVKAKYMHSSDAGKNKKDKKAGKKAFIVIIAVIAFFAAISAFKGGSGNTKSSFDVKVFSNNEKVKNPFDIFNGKKTTPVFSAGSYDYDYIARLDIIGTIQEANETYNQQWLIDTVRELKADENNKGLLLFIDSPGGAVYQADELYLELLDYKREGKPIWAYMASTAASGGYYISCAADKIYANRNTMTGSIGVLMGPVLDLTGLMEKYGIKATTFKSGKNKNMLNYNQPVTDEQKEIMQAYIDECYEQFVGIVAESRKMPLAKAKEIADGRIYSAKQAHANGLIDSVCGYDDAVKEMQNFFYDEKLTKDEEISVEIMTYKEEDPFQNLFKFLGVDKPRQQASLPELQLLEQFNKIPAGPAYYMGF